MTQSQMNVRCSNCGQGFPAKVRTIVDAQSDPQGKSLLLSGQLNAFQCPACGAVNNLLAPLLYHDGKKELLIAFVPVELGLKQGGQEEKIIGDMMNALTGSLPREQFKAYMFSPKRALTMQGVINQVLEADGVTPEMLEEQRQRVELIQQFIETEPQNLETMVQQHDDRINADFFRVMTLMAQRMMQDGRADLAERILLVQGAVAQFSSYGQELIRQQEEQQQIVQEVSAELRALGQQVTRSDLVQFAIRAAADDRYLQALVGLVRPALDYEFFQEFTAYISQSPAEEREWLEGVRERMLELTQVIDQQSQAAVQQAVRFLQAVVNSPDPDQILQANMGLIDDIFMSVLVTNIQEAERRGDAQMLERLKQVYEKAVRVLQSQMQPELRFVNELLSLESDEEMRGLVAEHAPQFGPVLLEVIDAVEDVLRSQGQGEVLQRLGMIREAVSQTLG